MRDPGEQACGVSRERPLAGLRVLCVGTTRSVGLARVLLTEQGADAWTVLFEADPVDPRPGGALAGPERAVAIGADGTGCSEELLASIDVVVDGRPTEHPAPAGWSAAELRARCGPQVVYCSLPPFSSADERRRVWASDDLLAGMLGAFVTGDDDTPELTRLPVSACFAALAGVLGIASALLARERFGRGQGVEVAAYDATFLAMGARALLVNGEPAGDRPPDPWGGPFCCADGRWIWINLATPKAVHRLARHVGSLERWAAQGLFGTADLGASSPARALLRQELRALFASRPALAWEELGASLGISVSWVRRVEDVHPAGDGPAGGGVDAEVFDAFCDERTVEVLRASGAAAPGGTEAAPWAADRPPSAPWGGLTALPAAVTGVPGRLPLSGVRVVDTTSMLAGPLAGRLLGELGAEVLKVNDPHEEGAGYRWQENRYHTDVNRGKATVLLDLSHEEGRAIGERILAGADVVLENVRADAGRRLGLEESRLRSIAPSVCHAHVSAFSLPSRKDAPGYEPNGQAIAGLMTWDRGTGVPRMQPFPVNDYGTGVLTALGVVLALYHQLRGNGSGIVTASLSRTAFFYARAMQARDGESVGGTLWRVRDGWVVADCTVARMGSVVERLRTGEAVAVDAGAPEAGLRAVVGGLRADELIEGLAGEGITGSALRRCSWQAQRPEVAARGLVQTRRYTDDYAVTAVGRVIHLDDAPARPASWVSRPGADGPAMLHALGYSSEEQQRLVREGVVALG